MSRQRVAPEEVPVLAPGQTLRSVTEKISDVVLDFKSPLFWFAGFGVGFLLLQLFKKTILFNLSGHGIFDMTAYEAYLAGEMA